MDNGSRDGLPEYVKSYGDKIKVIRSDVNLGFVARNNLALRHIVADYIVLLNDDVIVDSNWLVELVDEAEKDHTVGACQPKLRSLRDPKYFEYNGACGGMLDIYGVPLTRGRIFDLSEEDQGQYDKTAEVFWASGAALFLRGNILSEIGLLDEMFHAHMEEIDLCWRMRLAGYRVLSVPKSVVYHLGGGTPLPDKFFLKQRNNLIMILKNYGRGSLLRFLPLRVVQDSFSLAYYLVKKEKARATSMLPAYLWILRNLRRILISRYSVQERRKVKDKEIADAMVRKSVAIQHYVLGRKYFSQLGGLPHGLRYYLAEPSKKGRM